VEPSSEAADAGERKSKRRRTRRTRRKRRRRRRIRRRRRERCIPMSERKGKEAPRSHSTTHAHTTGHTFNQPTKTEEGIVELLADYLEEIQAAFVHRDEQNTIVSFLAHSMQKSGEHHQFSCFLEHERICGVVGWESGILRGSKEGDRLLKHQ
jgi:hypothetical protein